MHLLDISNCKTFLDEIESGAVFRTLKDYCCNGLCQELQRCRPRLLVLLAGSLRCLNVSRLQEIEAAVFFPVLLLNQQLVSLDISWNRFGRV
jgi:hypothetical protein